jgi:NADPH2:quinone reductase
MYPPCPSSLHNHLGAEGLSLGDRVGYTTRSQQLGGSYADCTLVAAPLVTKLPESVSTHDAAAILLQGLTALSQATVAVANEIKQGGRTALCLTHIW